MSDDRGFEPGQRTGVKTGGHAPLTSAGMGWSDFHAMAAARGEGMHPALLAAMERDRIASVKAALAQRDAARAASDGQHGGNARTGSPARAKAL
ncbi:hypothetical protein [Breoghania sp. L-A4]|uniref:hypothetical protein n=1 Tax=Breoghania sp. L-A4 TaxID=2304600 RepID=UPI0013C2DBAE|nr:hypothetical protein [Breoghania sp. L-A4]